MYWFIFRWIVASAPFALGEFFFFFFFFKVRRNQEYYDRIIDIPKGSGARIVTPPTSVNATVGANVSFECTIEGGPLYWLINSIDDLSMWGEGIERNTRQSGNRQMSTLQFINATISRNNTEIQCAVLTVISDAALLLVQGIYSYIGNMHELNKK